MRAIAIVVALAASAHAQRQPGWEIRVADRLEIAAGTSGSIAIGIAVDRGLVVSKDAPVIVDLAVPKGVTVRKRRLGSADAVDPGADAPRFAVAVRGDDPGEHAIRVRIRFWLCGGKSCRPIDVSRTALVVVAPTPAPSVDAGVADAP